MRTDITAAMSTALNSGEFTVANVATLHFDTPIHVTDHHHDISANGIIYRAIYGASKFPKIAETMENKKGTVTLELPNVDRVWDSVFTQNGFVDVWLNTGKAVFDVGGQLTGVLELWSGIVTKPVTDELKAKISAASYHTIFHKTSGVKTNTASYQHHLTPDQRINDRTMWWSGTLTRFSLEG